MPTLTRKYLAIIGSAAASAMLVGAVIPADAASRYQRHGSPYDQGYVTAESRFGHGTVSGPVRVGRVGPEVRLPGGTWYPCRRSCSETLRVETVDFWENRGAGREAVDNECGILGCLSRGLRF